MDIETLCYAVKCSLPTLKNARLGKEIDHSLVEQFQKEIKDILNTTKNDYRWEKEITPQGRSEKDSIDILGVAKKNKKLNPKWIIEIDATRSDQVSQKFLSRLALWGLEAPMHYVAILYPDTKGGKNVCEKYLRFGSEVLRSINKQSSITGLFVDPTVDTVEIQQYIVNGKKSSDHFELKWKEGKAIRSKECKSMSEVAKEAIKLYLSKNPVSYTQLKRYWGKFVEDRIVSKSSSTGTQTIDGITVYHYTQFRQYGICSYWSDFVQLCKKKGIFIRKMRKLYVGVSSGAPYKYVVD